MTDEAAGLKRILARLDPYIEELMVEDGNLVLLRKITGVCGFKLAEDGTFHLTERDMFRFATLVGSMALASEDSEEFGGPL